MFYFWQKKKVDLQSRVATFRLQRIQKLLCGSAEVKWCAVLHKLENLGLDKALFLMDPTKLDTSGLPVFYKTFLRFGISSFFIELRTLNLFIGF